MNYWVITDTHFGHHRMKDYCQRPDGFEQIILEHINTYVKHGDVLLHLGDFCIYKDEEWNDKFMRACPGKCWLIRGNHDRKSLGWYHDHGWAVVADEITIDIYGKRIAFSHKPIMTHDAFDINIHGHFHNTGHHPECETTEKHKLLFIEHTYRPVNLRKLVEGKQ